MRDVLSGMVIEVSELHILNAYSSIRSGVSLNFEATGERVPFGLLRERNEEHDEKAEQARAMRDEGMTLQQIADALGYKNRSSVSRILNE